MKEFEDPTPLDAKIDQHPISSFNLNAHGENPDLHFEGYDHLPEASAQLLAELSDVFIEIDPKTKQKLAMVYLNRFSESDQPPIIVCLQFSVNTQHPATNYELEQLAIQTGRKIIAFDNPGTGQSDPVTHAQLKDLKAGEYEEVASSFLRVLDRFENREFDAVGVSMGACIAARVAEGAKRFDKSVRKLVMFEPAALEDVSKPRLAWRFGVKEGANAGRYSKFVVDEKARQAQDGPLDMIKNFGGLATRDFKGNYLGYTQALAGDSTSETLDFAMHIEGGAKVTLISGGASEICRRDDLNSMFELFDLSGVSLVRLPGDTHAVGTGAARRLAWHINRALNA